MRELAGRLTEVDPTSEESVRIIVYFEALSRHRVSAVSVVRAATVLAGATAACRDGDREIRVAPDGRLCAHAEGPVTVSTSWPSSTTGGPLAWVGRDGDRRINDLMIVDRLSSGVSIAAEPGPRPSALATAIDRFANSVDRARAWESLGVSPDMTFRMVATAASSPVPDGVLSTVIVTEHGIIRASWLRVDQPLPDGTYIGHAVAHGRRAARAAWDDARIALLLTDRRHPAVCADVADSQTHPDVTTLRSMPEESMRILNAVAETSSVRQASSDRS